MWGHWKYVALYKYIEEKSATMWTGYQGIFS